MLYPLSKLLPLKMLPVGFSLIMLFVGGDRLLSLACYHRCCAALGLFSGARDRESDLVALAGNALATNHRSCSYFC